MKKILLIIAFLVILTAIPVTIFLVKQRQDLRQKAAPTTVMYLEPTNVTKNINDVFTLNVMADTGQNSVLTVKIDLTFSGVYLEAQSYQAGSNFNLIEQESSIGNGTISLVMGSVNPTGYNCTAPQVCSPLATITFKALANTSGSTPVQFANTSEAVALDPTSPVMKHVNVLLSTQQANVTIGPTTAASPSPTPSTSPGQPSPTPSGSPQTTPTPTPSTGTSPSPSASPTQVTTITYPTNGATVTIRRPTFRGTSFANATIVLSLSPNVFTDNFNADASGNWSRTPTSDLANGTYTLTVTGDNGTTAQPETASVSFTVSVGGTGGSTTATPTPTPTSTPSSGNTTATPTPSTTKGGMPVSGSTTPTLILISLALILLFTGFGATIIYK